LAARCDGADQNTVANFVAADARTEFLNHTDRFMTDNQTRFHWIFAAHNVQVSPANGREGDANDGFADSGVGPRHFFDADIIFAVKDSGPHCVHVGPLIDNAPSPAMRFA
jgi:hypothetical protein